MAAWQGRTLTAAAQQGDTLDALLWRVMGATAGVVEITLSLNPGLAALGAVLPEGHIVTLPAIAPASSAATARTAAPRRDIVQLWD